MSDSRVSLTGKFYVMVEGRWVEAGTAEYLVENGKIVKVISTTPRDFTNESRKTVETL